MSYILQALKASQESRDDVILPDVNTQLALPEAQAESFSPKFYFSSAIFLIVIVLTGLAGWWWADLAGRVNTSVPAVAQEEGRSEQDVSDAVGYADSGMEPLPSEDRVVSEQQASSITSNQADIAEQSIQRDEKPVDVTKAGTNVLYPLSDPTTGEVSSTVNEIDTPIESDIVKSGVETSELAMVDADPAPPSPVAIQKVPAPYDNTGNNSVNTIAIGSSDVRPAPPVIPVDKEQPVDMQDESNRGSSAVMDVVEFAPAEPEKSGAEEAERPLMNIHELPVDVQRDLPELKLTVHLYSAEPASRMIKVSGVVRREGDEISDGLVVDEITTRGAILTFRGYRFILPANYL